jgi:DNA sulfur modification protein DndE
MKHALVALALSLAVSGTASADHKKPCPAPTDAARREQDTLDRAVKTYIQGYPLVTMEMTRRIMTNRPQPEAAGAPMGQFASTPSCPDPSNHEVTTPNADTLSSMAWIDLGKEPVIVHVPEMGDRYWLMSVFDAWTNVIEAPGTRTTGNAAQDFAIVGPSWKGKLPDGMKKIESSTNLVWIVGRIATLGTEDDFTAVHGLQAQLTITPLSSWGRPYRPAIPAPVDPAIDMKTAARDQVNHMNAETFFTVLAMTLPANPSKNDRKLAEDLASLGIVPGKTVDLKKLDPIVARAIEKAPKAAQGNILAYELEAGKRANGWTTLTDTGRYGDDHLRRAYTTYVALGANLPADLIFPVTRVDAEGVRLSGSRRYVIHMKKGDLPPVGARGFWSITLYDESGFFAPNSLHRYMVNARTLAPNADGSIDIYVQHDTPGGDKESNWLPAPDGDFKITVRLYSPKGSWTPPKIERAT